ncbi:Late embryogenesis abundant protein, partial [Quillaja saponaria]
CCGCLTAFLVILAVVIVILIFTVFKIKKPVIKVNSFNITKLELINNNTLPKPGVNISVIADVSVKNPNSASFKFRSNNATYLYYHGTVVGEAQVPSGKAKARRTFSLNITVDIIPDKLMSSPNLQADFNSGLLTVTTFSRIPGRAKVLNIISKHVVVKLNCTAVVNISSQALQTLKCKKPKVSL